MNLILVSALIAVCGAAKLDRTYLPPSSDSSGGSPGSLQAPLTRTSEQGLETPNAPTGSYTNDFGGVVVDAAAGTRSSESLTGLGGPRLSYGSSNSKVGDAAFRGSVAGFRGTQFGSTGHIGEGASGQFDSNGNSFQTNSQLDTHSAQGFPSIGQTGSQTGQFNQGFQNFENKSERPQAAKDRNSNILAQSNDVDADRYSYGFETDNGIAVGENGVDVNGIQAEGGYSYQGDDGQVYKVTYVADERGYRPQGAHLPTPPPIPDEILKSLEQNAKEEASGLVDDGSYDAQKYNKDSDYTHDNSGNIQHNGGQLSQFGKRPESSSTFNNQNNQAFGTTGSTSFGSTSQTQDSIGQLSQAIGNTVGVVPNIFGSNQDQEKLAQFGISGSETSYSGQATQVNSQSGSTQFSSGSQVHSAFGKPSQANQFNSNSGSAQHANFGQSSHSSQSSGQSFGQTGNQLPSSGHTQGTFGSQTQFGSQFGQQASASPPFENKTPESGSQLSQQGFNTQFSSSSKPSSGQYSQDTSNTAHSQSAQPESGTSFKPQGSEAFSGASLNQNQDAQDFGKPFPQVFSGENFNRPSSGNFNAKTTFGQSQVNKGSANGFNRFPQPSGQFVSQNEYLPPSNNDRPQPNKSEASVLTNSGISNSGPELQKEQIPDFMALNRPKPNFASASASTSFGQPTFQPQPARPLNAFDTQPKPNQFNQQTTQFTQQTSQPSSQTQFNTYPQQSGAFATQSVPDFGTKPTTVPDTELTTPLEPNEKPASQGSQFPSQTTSNFGSFASKHANQGQAQFGFQGNSAFGQSTGQTLSPSTPTPTSQFGAASPQLAFQSSIGKGPQNPSSNSQFPQNAFGQTQQNQPSSGQGIDNSYHYNQPSKAFGALALRPQGSRFPSSPSYQFNGVATQNQFINKHTFQSPASSSILPVGATSAAQSTQTQGYKGITQAAISSFPSTFQSQPTQSSQIGMTQTTQFESRPSFNQQSNTVNQAQFTGAQPSYSQQSTTGNFVQENMQFGSVGTQVQSTGTPLSYNQQSSFGNQAQVTGVQERFPPASVGTLPSSQKPVETGSQTEPQSGLSQISESSESSSQQTTQTQQYQGTIYEYNKPAEVLPATQTDSSSGQISASPESMPSFGQTQNTLQNTKPLSQGSETIFDAQGNKPSSSFQFGQQAQTSQGSQISQSSGTQFTSQPAKPFSQFGQTTQQTSDSSSAQLNNQGIQTAQSFKPFGLASQDNRPFGSKIQFGSQSTQFGQNTQSFRNPQPSQPETIASQPQLSSQNFQNFASSQDSGYFYPANPKTQFGEESKNQFSQNSQPGRPQTGFTNQFNSVQQGISQSTSFNQQPQFNSASRPQFEAHSKNTLATFGQRVSSSPIQPFSPPQFGPSSASSQAFATGQATASASAFTSESEPFVSQDKTQISQNQPDSQDQSGQGTQAGVQSTKPFGTQESKELSSKPLGSRSSGQPLFKSACCQASKDSTPAQSTDKTSSSFPGAQGFNTQALTGKGEQFGGPRQPPSFNEQTGYHY